MNKRKQQVMKKAHEIFIEKGFHATSIQDILDYSGISKGTFYNYFSSKNELLLELFRTIYQEIQTRRDELLLSQDPSNVDIFIKQVELQMNANRENNLIPLFEEVLISNDEELKESIKKGQLKTLQWINDRFLDIFGESKKPFLLDCSIMFIGILQHNIRYYSLVNNTASGIHQAVQFSVDRILHIAEELQASNKKLFHPELLHVWLPESNRHPQDIKQELYQTVLSLKQALANEVDQDKHYELLDFIQDELLHSKVQRKFLIESALSAIREKQALFEANQFERFEGLIREWVRGTGSSSH